MGFCKNESGHRGQAGGAAEAIGDANLSARVRRDILREVEDEITRQPQWIAGSISQIQGK